MKRVMPFVLAAGAVACGPGSDASRDETRPPEPVLRVQAESLTTYVAVDGSVVAQRRAEISTRMMARIVSVPVTIGTRVRRGDVLIRLGTDDVAANRRKAEAAVTVARATRNEAARQAARMDTLYAQDAVPRVQRDQARLGLTQAEAQLAMARATLSEVETAEAYASIRTPFAGRVVRRSVDPGDLAAPGVPLLVVESDGPREAVLHVPVSVSGALTPGDTITVSGQNGRTAQATVLAVASGADPITRTVELRASLPSDWQTGMSVVARVPAAQHMGIAIPKNLVLRRGQLTGVRVRAGDVSVIRWVRLGRTLEDGRVEVLSGLEPGEWIVS